jgi:hypothetical protein
MRFNVTLVDPANYKSAHILTDMCRAIAYGLREMGRECDLTVNSVQPGYTNIIVGSHLLNAEDISVLIRSGSHYIVFQSEFLALDPASGAVCSSFQGAEFETIARPFYDRALAIWDGLEHDLPLLARMGVPPEKIKKLDFGYCEGLTDIQHRPYANKDVDVLFFGTLTEHRQAILEELNRNLRVAVFTDGPSAFRNDLIARAKINLSLHSTPVMAHFPQPRSGYLLNNGAYVVAEPSSDNPPMRSLVEEATAEALPEVCSRLLSEGDLAARAEAAAEQYRSLRMADVLANIL